MKINIISDTEFFAAKDHGVHTAFLTHVDMIKKKDLEISINSLKKADITHIHTVGPVGLFKLKTSGKIVVSAHVIPDSFVGSLKGTKYWLPLSKKYLRHFYNSADLILAVAPHVKEQLEKLGVTKDIKVFPNPVDVDRFTSNDKLRKEGRDKLGISTKPFVVLSVGQVQPRKGVGDFIEVAKVFPDIEFIWVGGKPFRSLTADDKYTSDLIKNKPANFSFKGPYTYKDMPSIFNAADVFFFPSFQENAPMALLEAAASGLPLLIRDNPEYKMLYKSGYIGGKTVKDFIEKIEKLHTDERFYKKQQGESKELASRFSFDALSEMLLEYYRGIKE